MTPATRPKPPIEIPGLRLTSPAHRPTKGEGHERRGESIQVAVFLITTCVWWRVHFATGERCGASCDGSRAAQADLLFFGVVAASFLVTIAAAVVSYRPERDLMWVPLAASGLIIGGYFAAAAIYNAATTAP